MRSSLKFTLTVACGALATGLAIGRWGVHPREQLHSSLRSELAPDASGEPLLLRISSPVVSGRVLCGTPDTTDASTPRLLESLLGRSDVDDEAASVAASATRRERALIAAADAEFDEDTRDVLEQYKRGEITRDERLAAEWTIYQRLDWRRRAILGDGRAALYKEAVLASADEMVEHLAQVLEGTSD